MVRILPKPGLMAQKNRAGVGNGPWQSLIQRAGVHGAKACRRQSKAGEGHAARALIYQANESVLKRRDTGITGGFHVGDG